MKKLNTKAGFTLAELLIVVAIIAILVAISIPVFSTQLERSRENTDLANMRAAKAEAIAYSLESADQYVLGTDGAKSTTVKFKVNEKFTATYDNVGQPKGADAVATTAATSSIFVYDATTGDLAVYDYKATPYGKGTSGGDYKTDAANGVLYICVDTEGTVIGAWGGQSYKKLGTTTDMDNTNWSAWNKLYLAKDAT